MSKIEQIQPNYRPRSNVKSEKVSSSKNPSFGRFNVDDLPKDAWTMIEAGTKSGMDKEVGRFGKLFEYLGQTKGEIQTQIINNLFTATLAPYVIYNNPFTNKDKKDRAYLAWRQPLSSVTAFTVNLPLTLMINSYLVKNYNEGYNKSIDLRWNPEKSYLKKQYVKEKGFKLPYFLLKEEDKKGFEKYEKDFKKDRLKSFTGLLSEDPGKNNSNFEIDEKTKTIYVKKNGQKIAIGKNIPNISNDKELKTFLNENNFYNRKIGDLLEKEFHMEFHKKGDMQGQLKPIVAEESLSHSKAVDFVKALGLVDSDKIDDTQLREIISKYRQEKHAPELAMALYGNSSKANIQKAIATVSILAQDGARSNEMIMGEKLGKETHTTLGQFFHQLGYKVSPTKDGDKSLQELADMTIKDLVDEITAKLSPVTDVFKKSSEKTVSDGKKITEKVSMELADFAKNMLERLGKRNSSYSGTHKAKVGILVNAFVMFLTCSALNWLYPRFMEKFKPDLVKSHAERRNK